VSLILKEGIMADKAQTKGSFWRFGGRLDTVYNWLLVLFFAASFFIQYGRFGGRLPEALGAAVGQTVVVAVVLFVIFKIVASARNRA
jgi:hypothetical protein